MRARYGELGSDSERIEITFEERRIPTRRGETVAAALIAAGESAFRSTRRGEKRGIFCGMGACQECLVMIDGSANRRACMTKVEAGMAVRRQSWLTAAEAPGSRRSHEGGDRMLAPEICVLGGGAGGLSAAIAAASAGAKVLLVDERPELGGQFYKQPVETYPGPGSPRLDRQYRDGQALIAATQSAGVEILKGAQLWGAFESLDLMIFDGTESMLCRPRRFIVAAGAYERGLPVPGWTLPGVMTTGAAQTLLRSYRVLPGRRVLIAGNGPLNIQVALELVRAGATVVGVAELSPRPAMRAVGHLWRMATSSTDLVIQGLRYLAALRRRGIPVYYESVLSGVEQSVGGLKAVLTPWGGHSDRAAVSHEIDAVCVGYGFMPSNEVLRMLGCRHRYDAGRGHLVTEKGADCQTTVPFIYAVGDCSGLGGARAAQAEGTIAGFATAESLGLTLSAEQQRQRARARRALQRHRRFQEALWQLFAARRPLVHLASPDTVICRCEELSFRDIEAGLNGGMSSIGSIKRLTRAGMGRCQGRYCGPVVAAIAAERSGQPLEERAFWAPRPPVRPIAITEIAPATTVPTPRGKPSETAAADRGVKLHFRPDRPTRPPAASWGDIAAIASFLHLAPASWLLPTGWWRPFCGTAMAIRCLVNDKPARRIVPKAASALQADAATSRRIAARLHAAKYELTMQIFRMHRPAGWHPRIELHGLDHLDAALRSGNGAILWVSHFVFNSTVTKIALYRLGHRVAHLSRPEHGFSKTRFGISWLNPIRRRAEDRFLDERIVIDRRQMISTMRRIRTRLGANGIVTITVGPWEGRQLADIPLLGGHLQVATGAITLAHQSNASLLPVFAVFDPEVDSFTLHIESPLDVPAGADKTQAVIAAASDYAARLVPYVRRYPDQWRGWGEWHMPAERST